MNNIKKNRIAYALLLLIVVLLLLIIENKMSFNQRMNTIETHLQQLAVHVKNKDHKSPSSLTKEVNITQKKYDENTTLFTQKMNDIIKNQAVLQQIILKQKRALDVLQHQSTNDMVSSTTLNEAHSPLSETSTPTEMSTQQKEEYINHITNNLENYWNEDAMSPEKNTDFELKMRENLSLSESDRITYLSCKNSICKLELQQAASSKNDIPAYTGISEVFQRVYPNPDGSQRVVMYLSQEDASFPKTVFE